MAYKASEFNYIFKCDDGSLRMYNSMAGTGSLLIVGAEMRNDVLHVLEEGGSGDNLPEYVREAFIKRGYLVPDERNEELALDIRTAETIIGGKYLSLIIMPTEQCNFRCRYCYEDFRKGAMSQEMQDALIKYVAKNIANYVGMSVVWFGGEPLQALKVIEYLSNQFIEICRRAKKTYVAGITTNGYGLTPEVYETLYRLKILNYQVTLDGFRPQHDSQRVLANGEGTFDRIVDNLMHIKSMRKIGVLFMIRTNFTRAILENIDEYLRFYKEHFGDDQRFTFYIQKASDWGGERVKDFSGELAGDVHAFVLSKLKEYGIFLGRSSHFSELDCELNTCYAAKKGHFVIGSDGTIYRCTTRFDFPENNVGKLKKGGYMEINENYEKWTRINEQRQDMCKSCFNRASCLPMKCPYQNMKSDSIQCPPMGGDKLGMFLERFQEDLFYHLRAQN